MDILKDQIILAKTKTDKLIANILSEKWEITPEVLNTNLNWQIGHIILANYLHGIASISGINDEFKEKVNVPDYIQFYGPKSNPVDFKDLKPSREELMDIYELTFSIILNNLTKLTNQDLQSETAIPNPAVKTKYEALLWLSQHQSWHNGQIATLKRIINS